MGVITKRLYSVKMECSNCGYEFEKNYPRGKEVPVLEICPNCGCLCAWQKNLYKK